MEEVKNIDGKVLYKTVRLSTCVTWICVLGFIILILLPYCPGWTGG